MVDWLLFFLAALFIVVAGSGLAIFAEVIVQRTNLSALWFGAVVVALVTSLPELVTGISAVRRDAPGLALGDVFGACMANMAILATMTLVFTTRRLLQRAALENVLTSMLAVGLVATALVFISVEHSAASKVGVGTIVIAVAYVFGMVAVRERESSAVEADVNVAGDMPLRTAVFGFVVAAAVIVAAGPQLAASADVLAERTGVGETFFGTLALALVTTLPEASVSIAALRLRAQNLAIANLLGSNATNMALLLPLDAAYRGDSLLHLADAGVQVAAATAVLLMSIGTMSIVLSAERNRLPVDLAAVLMLVVYVGGLWGIYASS